MKRLLSCALLLLLAACVSQPTVQPQSYTARESILRSADHWRLRAKLGIRSEQKKPQSGLLNWQQNGPSYQVRLSGPFGMGAVKLIAEPGHVRLQRSGEDDLIASSASELFARQTGIDAPLDDLSDWLKGLPGPGPVRGLNVDELQGTVTEFQQHGWSVQYPRYKPFGNMLMPTKIIAERDGTRLTVIVSHWSLQQ